MAIISLVLSGIATLVALATAWLTLFRGGRLLMTKPTMIALVFEGLENSPKVVIRSLLCSSGHRGRVIEAMSARLKVTGHEHLLTFWFYTPDNTIPPIRGGGVRVGVDGLPLYHHFALSSGDGAITYPVGRYQLEISAWLFGKRAETKLGTFNFDVDTEVAEVLSNGTAGAMFSWNPITETYDVEVQSRQRGAVMR